MTARDEVHEEEEEEDENEKEEEEEEEEEEEDDEDENVGGSSQQSEPTIAQKKSFVAMHLLNAMASDNEVLDLVYTRISDHQLSSAPTSETTANDNYQHQSMVNPYLDTQMLKGVVQNFSHEQNRKYEKKYKVRR